jgi:peptide/nickel transport system ATP-binding protein
MYLGKIVELGPVDEIYRAIPSIPTRSALLSARPSMDPRKRMREAPLIQGDPPNPINPPSPAAASGHAVPIAEPVCSETVPLLGSLKGGETHPVACHAHRPGSGHSAAPSEGAVH